MIIPLALAAFGLGFGVVLVKKIRQRPQSRMISYEPAQTVPGPTSKYVSTTTTGKRFTPEVIAAAQKWAKARGIPLQEIIATIYLESRGNPKAWANTEKEDSRGLMQINVRAWGALLTKYGLKPEDLWDIDTNIKLGTEIYQRYRNNVLNWISQSGAKQSLSLDTLTRLTYAGPAYVQKKILAGEDAVHPFKDAETYIDHWKVAMNLAKDVVSEQA